MGFVEFLGSGITKNICRALIVGQFGLLLQNVSFAADLHLPANQQQRMNQAKIDGNTKGLEYLKNAQNNSMNTNIGGNGDISFNTVKIDNSATEKASQLNSITTKDRNGSDVGLNLHNLSPDGANCDDPNRCKKYYRSGKAPDTGDLQGLYGQDEEVLTEAAQSSHDGLADDVKKGSSDMSIESHVYAVMDGTASLQKPNLKNDPIFQNSRRVLNNSVSNVFSDCGQTDYFLQNLKTTSHTPIYKTCVEEKTESCNIVKQPSLSILTYASGNNGKFYYGNSLCGENCTTYYLGDTANAVTPDYIPHLNSGSCGTGSILSTMYIANREAITKVKMQAVSYAGAVKVIVDAKSSGAPKLTVINLNSYGTEIGQNSALSCVNNHAYVRRNAEVDLTEYFKSRGQNPYVNFEIQYAGAKPIIELEVTFDPSKAAKDDVWMGTKECLARAESVNNGSLKGTVTCNNSFEVYSNGKIMANGTEIDPKYLRAEYGLKGECSNATVNVIQEPKENEENEEKKDEVLCSTLQKQQCSFVSKKCRETGINQISGQEECTLYDYVYDCGYTNDIESTRATKKMACPGDVACQGVDCMNLLVNNDANGNAKDFNKALALLNESQHAATDVKCTYTADGNLDCNFFPGERSTCNNRKMLGQSNDCCEDPGGGGNVRDQVAAGIYAAKVFLVKDAAYTHDIFEGTQTAIGDYMTWNYEGALETADQIDAIEGYSAIGGVVWDVFRNYTGVGQAFTKVQNTISKPIVSVLNNIVPYAGEVFAGLLDAGVKMYASDLLAVGIEKIVNGVVKEWAEQAISWLMKEAIPEIAKKLGLQAGAGATIGTGSMAEKAGMEVGEEVGQSLLVEMMGAEAAATLMTCLSVIGWVYAAYSITKMIATMMIACDEEEYEVASKVQQKLCDFVGGYCSKKFLGKCLKYTNVYCCFQSQLSRILNKQIHYALKGHHIIWPQDYPWIAWGDPEDAVCEGLTANEIQNANWSHVDLTEWLSLLKANGKLSSDNINIDTLRYNYLPSGGYNSAGEKNPGQMSDYK